MPEKTFGAQVAEKATQLAAEGRDANQIAKILCDSDPDACNYGIGIVLNADGTAFPTSPTLLRYATEELQKSGFGSYMNSMAVAARTKEKVLQWQRVPEKYWDRFVFAMPSDAGTGCVQTALEFAAARDENITCVGVEELGWPAYRAIAKSVRLAIEEFPTASAIASDGCIPLYQAGPMNTTGMVMDADVVTARAEAAAKAGTMVLLDRAYSGFEYARDVTSKGYDTIMGNSYARHIAPFVDAGVPFLLAVSPTKAFGSFALRPAGFLLVHVPEESKRFEMQTLLNTMLRARGSSFEHPSTRALVRAMVEDIDGLEADHTGILRRMADAEAMWLRHAKGSSVEALFTEDYAGLFRNPPAKDGAAEGLYDAHLYPVLSGGRCRINITGISGVEEVARQHVEAFAHFV